MKTADEKYKKIKGTLLYVVALIYKKGTKPFIEACPWTTEIVSTLDYHVQKHWPRMHGTPCTCDILVLVVLYLVCKWCTCGVHSLKSWPSPAEKMSESERLGNRKA